jgi:Arc/MetJ-type ribon-helix-helix transcriptional regulator
MRKAIILITALLFIAVAGCATSNQDVIRQAVQEMKREMERELTRNKVRERIQEKARTTPYMMKRDSVKEAVREAVLEMQNQMEKNFIRKMEVKEKAKISISTVEVVSAKWDGLIFRSIGDMELRFTIRESNGLSVEFDRYDVRVVCKYSSLFGSKEASRIGNFYFENPILVEPSETKLVKFKTNGWVRKTINSMNETLSFEDIRLYLVLYGKDANRNEIRVRTVSAPI